MTDLQPFSLTAQQNAPSKPYMTDEWKPSDERLWLKVLMVAKGRKREMTRVGPDGPRTIHAPNHGRGFRHWPNPKAVAWAVKQYNGYGGRWKGKDEDGQEVTTKAAGHQMVLEQMRLGAVMTTVEATPLHRAMLDLEKRDLVQLVEASDARRECYWDITYQGMRHVTASLGDELARKIGDLLQGEYQVSEARKLAQWFEKTFFFKGKTPRGQKALQEECEKLWWILANGNENSPTVIKTLWQRIEPHLGELTKFFTSEGAAEVLREQQVGSNLYLNRAGLNAPTLDKYARRLEQIWSSITGWRSKALVGGLKVAFVTPREMRGTATGRYLSGADELLVRTTPAVLKRGEGYGGFDYILVHELGHRYEAKNSLPVDFDRSEWWTSKYSRTESLAGSESFAELFAIGHFSLRGSWDPDILERFEKVMS